MASRWEYRVETDTCEFSERFARELHEALNEEGAKGWQLATVFPMSVLPIDTGQLVRLCFVYKRPVTNGAPAERD